MGRPMGLEGSIRGFSDSAQTADEGYGADALARDAPPSRQSQPNRGRHRRPIGQVLLERGELSPENLARVVALQQREDARFGDILLAQGMVTSGALYAALSEQYETLTADLGAEPPDARLIDALGAEFCIKNMTLPWKSIGGAIAVICSHPDDFARLRPYLTEKLGRVMLAVAPEEDIIRTLTAARRRTLTQRAETRVFAPESCRNWDSPRSGRYTLAAVIALAAATLVSPVLSFGAIIAWAMLTLIISSALKAAAALLYLRQRGNTDVPEPARPGPPPPMSRLPTVSILVPLFRERAIAERLVKRLAALDYPRELLDICLIVEEDDFTTQDALSATTLPGWMRQVTVPRGSVRTKPRALNFALDFARGSIVGVYDAEDAPEPGQIHKVVRRFAERGPEVACLQGVLDFYNPRENWLARAFTIEYAAWFRIVLPGYAQMGFAIPLGGTTLFFRRTALEELGGWDAHNVTEDADLGIRLARHGYRTELIDTVTKEEANCRALPWIRQRSRWIKGYAMTWGVHMRAPGRLYRELGLRKFLGVQFLFGATLSQFLLAPFLWSFWIVPFGIPHPFFQDIPRWGKLAMLAAFILSELLNIAVGMLAVADHEHRSLVKWTPTLHLYWPLASIAALKGLGEIITKPFYWDKTAHGHLHGDHDIWAVRRGFPWRRNRA